MSNGVKRSDSVKRSELEAAMLQALRRLSTCTVLMHQGIASRLKLHPTDHKCLELIIKHAPLTAGGLATRSGLTTGAVTGVIDRLVAKKYVKRVRDPNDQRRVILEAQTAKAMREIGPLFASIAAASHELFKEYAVQDLALMLDFIERCSDLTERQVEGLRSPNSMVRSPHATLS